MGYSNPTLQGPLMAFCSLAGLAIEAVKFVYNGTDFDLGVPDGADYKGAPWGYYLERGAQGEQPTPEAVAAWCPLVTPPPEQPPLTDVEIAKRDAKKHYLERREIRQTNIDDLMVDVAFAMVAEGSFTADNVDEEGSEFIAAHGGHIYRYVMGGNKTAQDLYDAVVASKNAEAPARAFPWLSDAILAIFSKALLGR